MLVIYLCLLFYHIHAACSESDYISVFGSNSAAEMTVEEIVHDWELPRSAVAGRVRIEG